MTRTTRWLILLALCAAALLATRRAPGADASKERVQFLLDELFNPNDTLRLDAAAELLMLPDGAHPQIHEFFRKRVAYESNTNLRILKLIENLELADWEERDQIADEIVLKYGRAALSALKNVETSKSSNSYLLIRNIIKRIEATSGPNYMQIQLDLIRFLGGLGTRESYDLLQNYLDHFYAEIRVEVLRQLASFDRQDSYKLFLAALDDKSDVVIREALAALRNYATTELFARLFALLERASAGSQLYLDIEHFLQTYPAQRFTSELQTYAQSDNPAIRKVACKLAAAVQTAEATVVLQNLLKDTDRQVRLAAVTELIHRKPREVELKLLDALDPDFPASSCAILQSMIDWNIAQAADTVNQQWSGWAAGEIHALNMAVRVLIHFKQTDAFERISAVRTKLDDCSWGAYLDFFAAEKEVCREAEEEFFTNPSPVVRAGAFQALLKNDQLDLVVEDLPSIADSALRLLVLDKVSALRHPRLAEYAAAYVSGNDLACNLAVYRLGEQNAFGEQSKSIMRAALLASLQSPALAAQGAQWGDILRANADDEVQWSLLHLALSAASPADADAVLDLLPGQAATLADKTVAQLPSTLEGKRAAAFHILAHFKQTDKAATIKQLMAESSPAVRAAGIYALFELGDSSAAQLAAEALGSGDPVLQIVGAEVLTRLNAPGTALQLMKRLLADRGYSLPGCMPIVEAHGGVYVYPLGEFRTVQGTVYNCLARMADDSAMDLALHWWETYGVCIHSYLRNNIRPSDLPRLQTLYAGRPMEREWILTLAGGISSDATVRAFLESVMKQAESFDEKAFAAAALALANHAPDAAVVRQLLQAHESRGVIALWNALATSKINGYQDDAKAAQESAYAGRRLAASAYLKAVQ